MSSESVGRAWRSGRFLIDRAQPLADDALHLYCPGGKDLPVEHLITLALLPIHDWNSALLEGASEGPITQSDSISACVFAIDPFRRIRDLLLELKQNNFHWVTNFPSAEAIDGEMRTTLDDLGFGLQKELEFVDEARALGFAVAAFATTTFSASLMLENGATALVTPDASMIDVASLPSGVPVIELEGHRSV
ncbi:phosphoenolpyruvate hydrolase family protein [Bauldia litoralis]|uniref:phosphoenolpyruvate hydrolase family protein n=1 Tax=Bauldia litoralis TaxID=665467 RepID=UPI000B87F9FB|nr:phosphoenolpyruvate hydrolase family protein [Bauldia litoralis]